MTPRHQTQLPRSGSRPNAQMAQDPAFQVVVGKAVIEPHSLADKLRLEPVGGILADGSTEAYGLDELDKMVEILARYNQPKLLADLKKLVEERRQAESNRD